MQIPIRVIALCCCFSASLGSSAGARAAAKGATAAVAAIKVQVRSVNQMQKEDADLLSSRQQQVMKAAEFHGYDVKSGSWLQTQVVCPYAANHLIMHYLKLGPGGNSSLFTALIPRGAGPVRIIPVLYNGGQASHVFGASETQRKLINEAISSGILKDGSEADWTTLGLCYAALAGAEPAAPGPSGVEETTPRLVLSKDDKVEEMSFGILGSDRLYQQWDIQFDRQLQVKTITSSSRAVHAPQSLPEAKPLPHARVIPPQP